jgi:hypothetical protein
MVCTAHYTTAICCWGEQLFLLCDTISWTVFEADKNCLPIIRNEGPGYGMVPVLTGFINFLSE